MRSDEWTLRPRKIYEDVLSRRLDEAEAVGEAPAQRAWVTPDGDLGFASTQAREQALDDGVFLLRVPESFALSEADRFANGFYRGHGSHEYGHFRELGPSVFNDPLLGFHERINQIEQFLLERRFWDPYYPADVRETGEQFTQLAAVVLRSVLRWSGIPRDLWGLATGGCSDGKGSYHLTFNHYRPDFDGIGLSAHKDDGFLTILRVTQCGLEVSRQSRWERITAPAGYFIVNFGLSMEILTRGSERPVSAILHRVAHQNQGRVSYGHFSSSVCDQRESAGIYAYSRGSGLVRVCDSRSLIYANDDEIYHGTQVGEDG